MATWSQIRQILESSKAFPARLVEQYLYVVNVPTENSRTQDVYVGLQDDYITFRSVICELNKVDLNKLFKAEFINKIPYGLGPVGDYLTIKHAQKIDTLDMEELAAPIAALSHYADFVENALTGGDVF